MLKFSSDKVALLSRRMSFPMEKNRSTEALEGTAVLYLMNSLTRAASPKKHASLCRSDLDPASNQVATRPRALGKNSSASNAKC